MSKMPPWTNGRITFAFHQDGTVSLRKADDGADEASSFAPDAESELAALFGEMAALGRAVRASALWLRGDKKQENGFFAGIPAEITSTGKDKATGEEKEYPFAYVAEQIEEFKPVAFALKARWNGRAFTPCLHAYAAISKDAPRRATFTRSIGVSPPVKAVAAGKVAFRRTKA